MVQVFLESIFLELEFLQEIQLVRQFWVKNGAKHSLLAFHLSIFSGRAGYGSEQVQHATIAGPTSSRGFSPEYLDSGALASGTFFYDRWLEAILFSAPAEAWLRVGGPENCLT